MRQKIIWNMKYADKRTHFTHTHAVSLEEIDDFHAFKNRCEQSRLTSRLSAARNIFLRSFHVFSSFPHASPQAPLPPRAWRPTPAGVH